MDYYKPIESPIYKGVKLSKNMTSKTKEEIQEMKSKPYAKVVGSLMYTMLCTKPDLSYVVDLISQYQSNPSIPHWLVVKRILRYIQDTLDFSLTYQTDDIYVNSYCDADFASDIDDKSTTSYIFFFGGGVISWSSKKYCIAKSPMEAKYVAYNIVVSEVVWLK
ncbi:unnamed protein product [Ilex paraguariensis]|uniref:Retrovirus-related Pol polyprotein from transposon TNT 1-94 n=1 Tax=Ilex paraguariensis TaxID=185542 RepID=A0ABC8UA08_9AQUA